MKSRLFVVGGALAIALLLATGAAMATPIDITNPEYDGTSNGWTLIDNGSFGETDDYPNGFGHSVSFWGGDYQNGYHDGGGVYQQLAATVAANTSYSLSAYVQTYSSATEVTLSLYAESDLLGSIVVTPASKLHWTEGIVNVAASSIPSGDLGKHLKIVATTDSYAGYVDHWSLNATATPEPSTLALLISAVLGLLCYAWRKRK
jgi:hypothetical protein